MSHPVDAYFSPVKGRIFRCFPGAEVRPGQHRMAQRVFDAIQEGQRLREAWKAEGSLAESYSGGLLQILEAGTGTGKTLGYLIPALLSERRPILVATRTKNLQAQLNSEDIPKAEAILGRSVKAVVAKGRSNYLCRLAMKRFRLEAREFRKNDLQLWEAIQSWLPATLTGDRAEVGAGGEGESELWDRLSARAERCGGKKCPHYASCFLNALKSQVAQADLVIVNHALLLADRILRESEFGQVLPDAPILVVDEAHDLEDQITESCAAQWSTHAMSLLLHDLKEEAMRDPEGTGLIGLLDPWQEAWEELLSMVPTEEGVYALDHPRVPLSLLMDSVSNWIHGGKAAFREARRLATREEGDELWYRLGNRIQTAFDRMEAVFAQPEGWVSTLTRERRKQIHFKSNPIQIQPFFDQHIRKGFETVILTSATLKDGMDFSSLGYRWGLTSRELKAAEEVPSPFDFSHQGLIFVPPGQPPRGNAQDGIGDLDWVWKSLEAMEGLVRASSGRALLLFTSRKALEHFHAHLRNVLPDLDFLVQSQEHNRAQLTEKFRTTPNSVLLGLASFWQGVDIPGNALVLVVVTALPFVPPEDPVVKARIRLADSEGGYRGFMKVQLPAMTLKLKQGIGRLIRSRTDRGVIAILDPRICLPGEDPSAKAYARQVRSALPPFPFTRDWQRVLEFLKEID